MAGKFVPDQSGIRDLATAPELGVFLGAAVTQIAALARTYAPKGFSLDLSQSITGEVVEGEAGIGLIGRVNVWDFKGGWKELGTDRESPSPYLWPATEQVMAGTRLSRTTVGQTA